MKPAIGTHAAIVIGASLIAVGTFLAAGESRANDKDRIETPAIGQTLCVHNLFQSNMVIQRDKPIRVHGWAAPGEKVTVAFDGKTQSCAAAADRSWTVELPAMPASSEPRTMVVQGKESRLELENILLGDVWVLGGQSNMEFPLARLEGKDFEILSANFKNMRYLKVPQLNGPEKQKSFPRQYQADQFFGQCRQGYWDVVSPANAGDIAGMGYIFARGIHLATQIPIGIIDLSRGGTCIETWTPDDVLRAIDTPEVKSKLAEWDKSASEFDSRKDLERRIGEYNDWVARMKSEGKQIPADRKAPSDLQPGPAADMNRPGNCYASSLAPLEGFAVKGAIWHQGYNNALEPNGHVLYAQVFPEMIKAWRAAFRDPTMPFGIISQETEGEPQSLANFLPAMLDEGTYIREVHYKTFLSLWKAGDKNIGYASSFDQHRAWYHPQLKIPVGERIAAWALATQYGKNIRWLPPQLKSVKTGDGRLVLEMDSWVGPYNDGPILGFVIAGKDGRFQPAKAEWLDKNAGKGPPNFDRASIVLTSPLVPEPTYFRYAWARNPLENLKSSDLTNLPFDTQRNDTWTVADMYELYTGKKTKTPNTADGGEYHALRTLLKADDVKRQIEEAKTLLKANKVKLDD